ncbi:AAA family ATPase [Kineosporia succinea]
MVGIDGRSGVGKSTLSARVGEILGEDCRVIGGDDFYTGGTPQDWDARSPAEKAAHCLDWRRQHAVLSALRRGEEASWHPFDWDAFDGSLHTTATFARPARVVVLDCVYSCRPELAGLLDLRVLVETDPTRRRERLRARDGDDWQATWIQRWEEAEDFYFGQVVTRAGFDLVVTT